jgi:hypothetical protein
MDLQLNKEQSTFLYNFSIRTNINLLELEKCVLKISVKLNITIEQLINEVFKQNTLFYLDKNDNLLNVSDNSGRIWKFISNPENKKFITIIMILYNSVDYDITEIFGKEIGYLSEDEIFILKMKKTLQDTVNNEFNKFNKKLGEIENYYDKNKLIQTNKNGKNGKNEYKGGKSKGKGGYKGKNKGKGGKSGYKGGKHLLKGVKGYIIKIDIRDNKIFQPDLIVDPTWDRTWTTRGGAMIDLISKALETFTLKKNITIYIFLGDYILTEDYPILGFAKPVDSKGILMPDWTFVNAYKSAVSKDWDTQIEKISTACSKIKYNDKKDICFFQGGNTSKGPNKSNIRGYLNTLSKNDKNIEIVIDSTTPPTAATDWCKYKFLLDLPGAHPWSVRLKELFLTKSLVFKIDLHKQWVNFYSSLFFPGKDYVTINYNDNRVEFPTEEEAHSTYRGIKDTMEQISEDKYMEITESAFNKAVRLDSTMVNFYIKCLLQKYEAYFD